MATITQAQAFRVAGPAYLAIGGRLSAPNYTYPYLYEGTTQSYSANDALMMSSGTVVIATSASNAGVWLGISTTAAVGDSASAVNCELFAPNQVWVANVYHTSGGSAITATTQVGVAYDIVVASGNLYVDIEHTTDAIVRVLGFYPDDTIGDTYGRVYFQFVYGATVFNGISAT